MNEDCDHCDGTGIGYTPETACPVCGGTGNLRQPPDTDQWRERSE